MRTSIGVYTQVVVKDDFGSHKIVEKQHIPILNMYGETKRVEIALSDWVDNGYNGGWDSFVVRLPRRLGVNTCHCLGGSYILPKYRNSNVK